MSGERRHLGVRFLGPTICEAVMQATGMVRDHTTDCFPWAEVRRLGATP